MRARPQKLALLMSVVLAGLGALSPLASADPIKADSAAPVGAAPDWLPAESWVMERWVPFNEAKLVSIFQEDTSGIASELDRTGLTLNELARQRGIPTRTLAGRLVASRHLTRRSKLRATLLQRTRRVLSQSHLSVHLLSHVFHTWTITRKTQSVFGVNQSRFSELYFVRGLTMQEVAAVGGIRPNALRIRALRAAAVAGQRGIQNGAMSTAENRVLRTRDRLNYQKWAEYHVPVRRVTDSASTAAHTMYCVLG
ncbi:hypothetical protein [Baekduia sp. Peel2402]|uniref:hypothetical protein n=1 Tax=Baekduia sp. Peel2402 TaxID=3458296 RepID=UPI00403EADCB